MKFLVYSLPVVKARSSTFESWLATGGLHCFGNNQWPGIRRLWVVRVLEAARMRWSGGITST
jgi:hypothetical protein